MSTPRLDTRSLHNALNRLTEGYTRYLKDISDTQIRDGLIQRFEFTYEISHKLLKRYLEMVAPNPEVYDAMPFADLIRSGNEQGLLLSDWPQWRVFREMRVKANDSADESTALNIVHQIPAFIKALEFLLLRLNHQIASLPDLEISDSV